MPSHTLDLRERGNLPAHSYAFYQLRELQRGQTLELLSDEEPGLLMKSIEIQLRHSIVWRIHPESANLWRIQVQHKDDVAAENLLDLLTRDHERIDTAFANALHLTNAFDLDNALVHFRRYAQELRQHLQVENDLLAPLFDLPRKADGSDPTSIMLREHEQILEYTVMMEDSFAKGADAAEVAPYFAIISGALAKHEGREENHLFPYWQRLLRDDQHDHQALLEQTKALIGWDGTKPRQSNP